MDKNATHVGFSSPRRMEAAERRQQIVETAFAMIAEAGFENFRIRDVAERVNINSATLHHYFPTKEDLITDVGAYLECRYRDLKAPQVKAPGVPLPLQALRQEFADARCLRQEHPDVLAVSAEFLVQARRDRIAARSILTMHNHWRGQIERIVREGRTAEVFGPHIDPLAAGMAIVGALWGATGLMHAPDDEFDRMCGALEAWLTGVLPHEGD